MNCLICLKNIEESKYSEYHDKCLRSFFGTVKINPALPFTRKDFFINKSKESTTRVGISGVQPKLGVTAHMGELVTTSIGFTHMIKPSPESFPEAAENEHLSMSISKLVGIKTAEHALVRFKDHELVYITKRFDLQSSVLRRTHQEDMMQAMGIHPELERNAKYDAKSYEEVGIFLKEHSSLVICADFFQRVFFNFMIGNDDYHLKNITVQFMNNKPGGITLSPHYDALNTGLWGLSSSETACVLFKDGGGFSASHDIFGFHTKACFEELARKLGLTEKVTSKIYKNYLSHFEEIFNLVETSFLSEKYKIVYKKMLIERREKFEKKI